ncbi:MAG: RNA polymerase factor sigma-32 [Myxococcales bacterium]|nr:RNA polymerase factor sigma-32 [Myxococcales bacterium]
MAKGRRNDSGDAESGRDATPEGGEAPATAVVAAPVKRSARSAPRPAKGAVEDDDEEAGDGEADGEDDEPEAVDAELVDDDAIVGAAEPADDEVVETDEVIEAPASKSEGALTRFDPMAAYLREVQRHPLLTPEATKELAIRFQTTQDPAAAAMLVTSNLRLVVKIAYEYRRAYKNIMDLVQEGNIGLMQAVKRYDPYRGVKLSTYAALWIRAYILRYVINNWRLVKLGTTQVQRKLFFNLRKKRAELQAMGIDPTHAEIAKQLDVPEHEVAEMDVRLASGEKSLDAPVGDADGSSTTRIDLMPATGDGPEALAASEEMQTLLKAKLGEFRVTLEGKEKDLAIFDERLVADEPLTLQELGDRFGISRERVRQLEQRLTTKLRLFLSEELGDATEVL